MKKASEFLSSLPEKAQKKITYNLLKVEGGEINKELFKKLDDTEIWEFRTLFNGVSYRLFAFWDTTSETLIVATHGIIKKAALTERNTLINAPSLPRALPGAMGNNWAYSPPQPSFPAAHSAGVLNKIGCSSAISSKLDCARLALFLQNAPTLPLCGGCIRGRAFGSSLPWCARPRATA